MERIKTQHGDDLRLFCLTLFQSIFFHSIPSRNFTLLWGINIFVFMAFVFISNESNDLHYDSLRFLFPSWTVDELYNE